MCRRAASGPAGAARVFRSAVLGATLAELSTAGYSALSLQGIAHRAGVHKTTVYRRWGSRDRLLLEAILERSSERVPIPDTGSLRGDLLAVATAVIAMITTPEITAAIRAFVSEAPREPALAVSGHEFWEARFSLTREVIERAVQRRELPKNANPDLAIEALIGPIYLRLLVTREPLDAEYAGQLVDHVIAGMLGAPATGSQEPRRPAAPSPPARQKQHQPEAPASSTSGSNEKRSCQPRAPGLRQARK